MALVGAPLPMLELQQLNRMRGSRLRRGWGKEGRKGDLIRFEYQNLGSI